MIYSAGLLIFVVSFISTSSGLSPCVCSKDFKPVCGSDGITYNNECLLNCATARNNGLTLEKRGRCAPPSEGAADCICTLNYLPVCGTDGVTYANKCALDCLARTSANVGLLHEGACKQKRETVKVAEIQPCRCTKEGRPVCGTDGNTYGNPCMLNCAKEVYADLQIDHVGRCSLNPSEPAVARSDNNKCTCARNLEPVCASNGKTYSNACLMRCAGEELTVEKNEPCT